MKRAQLAVLLFADGQTAEQVAIQLDCAIATVRSHVRTARQRYVAHGRAQPYGGHRFALRALLVEDGLLPPELSSQALTMVSVGTSEGGRDVEP